MSQDIKLSGSFTQSLIPLFGRKFQSLNEILKCVTWQVSLVNESLDQYFTVMMFMLEVVLISQLSLKNNRLLVCFGFQKPLLRIAFPT